MAEVYVTLGEAAELERVKYNTMVKRVLRKQESFVTKTEKSENGGKDVVLVAVSSLSKQARNAWKEREKLKSFTEEFPDKKEDEQKPEVPWYVNTDVDWYIENYKERYYKAVELGNVVRKFLQYDEGDRTKCDNRNGADGEQTVSVKRGTFVWENDGTIKETDILKKCYIKDEKTVTITADGSSVAGTILEVDDDGVTVDITQV